MNAKAVSDVGRALKKLLEAYSKANLVLAKVTEVDKQERTISVVDIDNEEVKYSDVLIQASDSDGLGLCVFPQLDSQVLIGLVSEPMADEFEATAVLLMTSQIESYELRIGSQSLVIDASGFALNEGQNGGLVKVAPLVSVLNGLVDRVNNHQHSYASPGGPAITTPEPNSVPIAMVQASEISNPVILH